MKSLSLFALLSVPLASLAAEPSVLVKGLKNPTSVCVTATGKTFIAVRGDDDGTGSGVLELKDGKTEMLAEMKTPFAIVPFQKWLFAAQSNGAIQRIDLVSKVVDEWVAAKDLPKPVTAATAITVDERGFLYLCDAGAEKGDAAVYSIGLKFGPKGLSRGEIKKVVSGEAMPGVGFPQTLLCDGMNHLLVFGSSGEFVRVALASGKVEPVATLDGRGAAMCVDEHGRLFLASGKSIWAIPRPGLKPVKVFEQPGPDPVFNGLAFDPVSRRLLFGNQRDQSVFAIPAQIPGWEVDESPLPVVVEQAFGEITWTGWDSGAESGRANALRPIVLTHANDGSGRTFVATQQGVLHIIEKDAKATKVFLDIQNKVRYVDNENEQGLLGLAFHPNFKKNGEFYVFYTDKTKRLQNVLSRFKVSKDDPNKADPASEEELLRVSHKFWNHNGGTVAFGPDGYLYLVLGDGGAFNDPDDHGQKTNTLLAKILRLDVNSKGEKTAYAIPKDNPFIDNKDYRPEIFALGVRNPWRLSFDRKTGQGWFGDVGQNLYEEINLLEKGANYGWRRREGFHPFWSDGVGPKKELTEPIWEYNHDVGKSITAGNVYRGKAVPALDGYFLYADYVSGKVWGLKYDEKSKKVTANRSIAGNSKPIMSFGEDEAGEVYMMTYSDTGKGVFRFKTAEKK